MKGIITINGQIGSYTDEKNQLVKGVELLDVIAQVQKLPEGTQIVEVQIAGPGGLVDTGDQIYDYLESLKKKYTVNTLQVGDIASIDTKLFLVGQDRKADPKYKFMIHNPWANPGPGDSKHQAAHLEGLLLAEEQLRKFYTSITGISSEGLAPLMDQETVLTAQQCIDLKFATSLVQAPVMALKTNNNKMTFQERVDKVLAALKGQEPVKAMELQTADGRVLMTPAENLDSLVGSDVTLDGQPAPDGEYQMADGMMLEVAGGKVSSFETPEELAKKKEEAAKQVAEQQNANAEIAALKNQVQVLAESLGQLIKAHEEGVKAAIKETETAAAKKIEEVVFALKQEIGTTHTPKPASAVYAKGGDNNKTIAQVMAEKAEQRKNKSK